jgi:hypothetical protein
MYWGVYSATMRATCNLSSFVILRFYLFRIQIYEWETNIISLHRLVNYDTGKSNGIGRRLHEGMNITINVRITKH